MRTKENKEKKEQPRTITDAEGYFLDALRALATANNRYFMGLAEGWGDDLAGRRYRQEAKEHFDALRLLIAGGLAYVPRLSGGTAGENS